MSVEVAELPHLDWHRVGALGSLVTQVVMVVAVFSTSSRLPTAGWIWYGLTYLAVGGTYLLIRRRHSSWWYLVWPALCLARIMTFTALDHAAATLVPGFITMCFLYAGLTQPQWRSLLLLPIAIIALNSLLDLPPQAAIIRLSLAVLIWTASAELPAYLIRQLVGAQDLLVRAARTDVLTGARNRFGMADTLEQARGSAFLVIIDLDHFKSYNDRYGHHAGDLVLSDFADMLHRETRQRDVVIRYGGEEFLVVLAGIDATAATTVVDRWAATWRAHPSGTTFSAGVTDLSDDDSVSMADAAMYCAKAQGRDRAVVQVSAAFAGAAGTSEQ